MFVSEPVHNLIHREVMKPKGVTFTSQLADDEQTSEFLASSDNWFRPTMIQTGPDGALWVADMYRYVIEHRSGSRRTGKRSSTCAGHDLGHIYRIYPTDKTPRTIPRLDKLKPAELVKQLESPSGWVADTANQLLVGNQWPANEAIDAIKGTRGMRPAAICRRPGCTLSTPTKPWGFGVNNGCNYSPRIRIPRYEAQQCSWKGSECRRAKNV